MAEPDATRSGSSISPESADRRRRWLRLALSGFTLAMVAMSWPLWTEGGPIARVPFVADLPPTPVGLASLLSISLAVGVVTSRRPRGWNAAFAVSALAAGGLILGDQHRFQAWIYQYVMVGLFLACLPNGWDMRCARWWYASLYLHSALSKLDVSFCDELGSLFLSTALRPLSVDPMQWAWGTRAAAVLTMPLGELAVAMALLAPRWRRVGVTGAVVLHLSLIAILGPLGLGHSAIVLTWNAAILTQVLIAFHGAPDAPTAGLLRQIGPVRGLLAAATLGLFGLGVVMPLGERWGWFDAWPAHALYASHVERLTVAVSPGVAERLDSGLTRQLGSEDAEGWRTLRLTDWSRAVRGTPVYPQNRATLGLAEALAARYGDAGPVRVIVQGPAGRWNGRRTRTELSGTDAIRSYARRYRLNAHPVAGP